MAIPSVAPLPERGAQGSKLTVYQHDIECHRRLWTGLNATIDVVNQIVAGIIGALPTGAMIPHLDSTAPTGYLMANGQSVSTTTYADLFAMIGYVYGGAGASFNVPDMRGKAAAGCNPMGGLTNGSYTVRALGTTYGAETTAYTPAGSISQASVASITSTCGVISPATITATLGAISLASVTATLGAINIASLTSTVNLTNGALSGAMDTGTLASNVSVADHTGYSTGDRTLSINGVGTVTVNAAACIDVTEGGEASAAQCLGMTVDATAIATALSLTPNGHDHTIPTMDHDVTNGAMTGAPGIGTLASNVSVASATIGGSIPSPAITVGGTIASPAITVGGTISSPTVTIGGSIPVQTFTGTEDDISTMSPRLATSWIIKT